MWLLGLLFILALLLGIFRLLLFIGLIMLAIIGKIVELIFKD